MAQFSITIADADVDRVTAALSHAGGFPDVSVANAQAALIAWVQQTVANVELSQQAPTLPALPPAPVISPV